MNSQSPAVDALVNSVAQSSLERRQQTYDNTLSFYSTPQFRYKGLVAKTANTEDGKLLLPREASVLLYKFQSMEGRNRVPEIMVYNEPLCTIVEQRIYGDTALDVASNDTTLENVAHQMLLWLRDFHAEDKKIRYSPDELHAYKHFISMLDCSPKISGGLRSRIRENIENWGKREFSSPFGVLHGDFSPIDFVFGNDGNSYALDFNATHQGPVEEDVAYFMANSYCHYADKGIDKSSSSAKISQAADSFFGGEVPAPLPLFLAKAYYQKAIVSGSEPMAEASLRLLASDAFKPELLVFS